MTDDRFGAAAIRRRVLAAWSDSPPRFREDANAEEDLVLGGYRDRLIVELAQNAADAAARAGEPGRLLFALRDGVLVAANTGARLDADGVQALATLRASAKRDGDTVGRFGVGFAAVLAVTDEPAVISRAGGVRFSTADTRSLVGDVAELATELTRRDGHVPALRLPFATEGTPPDGYDTAVILPLRDQAASELVAHLLDEVDDTLLLALPDLAEIVVESGGRSRTLTNVGARWHVLTRSGDLPADVLATRPVEERGRTRWQLTWALPKGRISFRETVHAPTPSDEPLPWPALLIATFPLDPSRRHVAEGPVTDAIVRRAADAWAELLAERAESGDDVWDLVVTGLPAGRVDAALREHALEKLVQKPILHAAEARDVLLRPRDAVALEHPVGADERVVEVLAPRLAGLVLAPRPARAALELLGVRRLPLSDVIETLPATADPARWREVYAAFAPLDGDEQVREALSLIPVPLADGTVARGARGLLTSTSRPDTAEALAVLGARIVHPEAAHPLLERLGAVAADARALLELPSVRSAVQDEDLDDEKRDAVLTLVQAAVEAGSLTQGDLPWLGDLPLPDERGELTPAAALALPGSPAARWFDEDEVGLTSSLIKESWPPETLIALGVLDGPGLVRASDVAIDESEPEGPEGDLDGWDAWCALAAEELDGAPGAVLSELVAVRDLDLVRPDALPEVVAAIATSPVLRPALIGPARVVAGGRPVDVPPYTAWWLREELWGRAGVLADPGADAALRALLPEAPPWVTALDPAAQRALGVVASAADLDAAAVPGVLERLADDAVDVPAGLLTTLLARLAELALRGLDIRRPALVRGLDGDLTVVVEADRAFVAEAPMYRQRADLGVLLPAPPALAAALADLLDLPLGSELAPGEVFPAGVVQETTPEVLLLLPGAPTTWVEHESLTVDGIEVDWWVTADDDVHAATTEGLARGLAWAGGRWELRALVAQVLETPEEADDVMIDQAFG